MPDSSSTDGDMQWVEQIRAGDRVAFERLFYTYYEDLCKLAQYYVHTDVAEDLVQDVFARIWQRRVDWELKASLRAYLYGAARHRALKHLRHEQIKKRWVEQEIHRTSAAHEHTDEALRHQELERAAEDALALLPERRRLVFILSRRHELTYAEIATALDISVKTVETQMGRALRSLRKHLSTYLSLLL